MRRRLPPAPREMPARLRCFDPTDWGATADATSSELHDAQTRHTAAWLAWCQKHDVSPLDVILGRRRLRLLATPAKPTLGTGR